MKKLVQRNAASATNIDPLHWCSVLQGWLEDCPEIGVWGCPALVFLFDGVVVTWTVSEDPSGTTELTGGGWHVVLGMGKHSFGVHDQSVIVRAAIAMIRPRRNLFASMCQPHNPKDHHGSSPVSSQCWTFFWFFHRKICIVGSCCFGRLRVRQMAWKISIKKISREI